MQTIQFSVQEKDRLVSKIQKYFTTELEQYIGQFDAEFLLDFFSKEIGGDYYNRGLTDAQTIIAGKLEDLAETINEAISEIEKPINS